MHSFNIYNRLHHQLWQAMSSVAAASQGKLLHLNVVGTPCCQARMCCWRSSNSRLCCRLLVPSCQWTLHNPCACTCLHRQSYRSMPCAACCIGVACRMHCGSAHHKFLKAFLLLLIIKVGCLPIIGPVYLRTGLHAASRMCSLATANIAGTARVLTALLSIH